MLDLWQTARGGRGKQGTGSGRPAVSTTVRKRDVPKDLEC